MRLPHRRRALASLELVLALPLLVFLAAMILAIGRVGLTRTGANLQARRDAWVRPLPNGAAERAPLPDPLGGYDVIHAAGGGPRGLASGAVDKQVPLAPMLPTSIAMKTRVFVLLDPLDHVTAPFPSHARFTPDRRVVRLGVEALSELANIAGGLGDSANKAKGETAKMQSGMDDMRKQGDVLKERKKKILEESRAVAENDKLSKAEKDKKLKELQDELAKIVKSEADMKNAEKRYGGL